MGVRNRTLLSEKRTCYNTQLLMEQMPLSKKINY